jgi:hypothetical protein
MREWMRCRRIRPEVRVGVTAFAGAVIAPFVVFVAPVARLYWLITGRHFRRPFDALDPRPFVMVNPFPINHPPEIRELLERPEYQWEPGPGDVPWWYDTWARVGQALFWGRPTRLSGDSARTRRTQKSAESPADGTGSPGGRHESVGSG